ncbi:MAG: RimK family alpha-L-glutamate ligase [Planctomycetota bacterium]
MKIGVFGNPDSWYVQQLADAGLTRGHQMHRLEFPMLESRVKDSGIDIRCGDVRIQDLDAVIVRTMPPGTLEQVVTRMNLLQIAETSGVQVLNPPRSLECAVDKYLTTQRLALAGLPVPGTIVCESSDMALNAFHDLGEDIVVKPLFGSEGRGILRVSDSEIALRTFRTLERLGAVLYLQEFLRGPMFDLRLLLLDGKLLGAMKRTPRPGDFRANISQQGTAEPHRPSLEESELAQRAADVTQCVFAGVDLMYDQNEGLRVIEVNAIPGWRGLESVCRVDVPGRILDYLESSRRGCR